jgi:trans-aconitate methyltransferase
VTGRHSAWLAIPLGDYERHMEEVGQLTPLSDLFGEALAVCRPRSVAILGVAGGNGLERINPAITTRVVGLDISNAYLEQACSRYPRLETCCVDLAHEKVQLTPVELVHAALIFEHAGLGLCLENALALVVSHGHFSAVLQLPGEPIESAYKSVRRLGEHFTWIEPAAFRCRLERRGMTMTHETRRPLPFGKAFWMGVFATR